MDAGNWIAIGALAVAALSLLSKIIESRKAKDAAELAKAMAAIAAVNSEVTKCNSEVMRLELEFIKELRNYTTKEDFTTQLAAAMAPVLAHVERTEALMDELLRSGLLARIAQHQASHG